MSTIAWNLGDLASFEDGTICYIRRVYQHTVTLSYDHPVLGRITLRGYNKSLLCPAPIRVEKLSNMAMVSGREKTITHIIDNDIVKHWIGIGWIETGNASEEDYRRYPRVQR